MNQADFLESTKVPVSLSIIIFIFNTRDIVISIIKKIYIFLI